MLTLVGMFGYIGAILSSSGLGYIAEKKKMKPLYKMFLPAMAVLAAACSPAGFTDVGQGYETNALFAPWDGLQDDTRFCCHSTAARFFFSFEVTDTTICLSEPFLSERDVEPEDRVEVFFCPLSGMEAGYHCAEIDPEGRIMDYSAKFYRDFDYGWDFKSMEAWSSRTPWGYRVAGSVLRSELEDLGLNLEKGFLMGVFRADFKPDGSVNWYSLVPTADTAPDFHKPDVLFRCTMNPKPERRGVVVYPNDITSVGLDEWENRIRQSGINLIGLHAATVNDPIDTLEAFIKGSTGKKFLEMCGRMGVDVEYELHALQNLLPRDLFESHPEYFVLKANGERRTQKGIPFEGHLCHSSDVWNEIYEDIVSYAKGEPPTVRGVAAKGWPIMTFRRPWVDVMPQDGFQPCQCPQCKASYNTNEFHYATELVWGRTVELAKRLKAANVPIRITQMAYTPYRRIPKIDIPDNVDVMVAEGGPWSVSNPQGLRRELDEIRGWAEKLGHKVWIWTYPGKYGSMNIPDIPNTAPRAWHKYYKLMSPYIFGSFAESENDRWLYNYLNYFVFGKFCWNNKVDVEALLEEHFRLMFGAAAAPMAEFVRQVEDKWINEVAGRLVDTDLGPTRQPPSTYELFTRVYSPELLSRWKALFDRAFAAVPKGSLEHRRVALYAREFLVPLKKASKAYLASVSVERELQARAAHPDRPNLFVNGDFSYGRIPGSKRHYGKTDKSQWKGGWIGDDRDEENVSIVKTGLPEGIPAAMRIEVKDQAKTVGFTEHFQYSVGHLKPDQKYRISLFVKLENVVSRGKGGGFGMRVWDDKNVWFPERRITGTTDWIHQEYTFTAGPKCDQCGNTCTYYLWNATGTLWVAGARFEEVE